MANERAEATDCLKRFTRQVRRGILSTGQVADICRTTIPTVHGWTNNGLLKFHYLPRGSRRARRVEVKDLQEFMATMNMPPDWLTEFLAKYDGQHP